jgi:iron-sulfur cluster protein
MSFDTFTKSLQTVPGSVDIHFLGMAEPWLNPECTRMVLHAHEKGHRLSVSTTLAGMRSADIDAVGHIPFDAFILHVPSNDDRMNIKVDAHYIDLLNHLRGSRIQHLKFKRFGDPHPDLEPVLQGIEAADWPMMNRANNLASDGIRPTTRIKGRISCHRKRNNVLLPNGDVALCCNDYGLQHILGNLLEDSYDELFHGEEFWRIRAGMNDDHAETLCRYCSEPCIKVSPS